MHRIGRQLGRGLVLGGGAAFAMLACAAPAAANTATAADQAALADLSRLSLEELANVEITSVSKRPEALSGAPAAIYVIGSDDIRRSGADSLAEALRLAPNLQVARLGGSTYAISARGFNHRSGTANKLQVMIDGRSVYTPLYSGVFWDAEGIMLDDIERIEVVSGPGGALWGANAVNGVINVITRKAEATRGGMVSLTGGADDNVVNLRYGGRLGQDASFRVYGMVAEFGELDKRDGAGGADSWDKAQGGFRVDWDAGDSAMTLQGDVYDGSVEPTPGARAEGTLGGGNLLGRWTRRAASGGALELQAYYDTSRRGVTTGVKDSLSTYDLDVHYSPAAIGRHALVVGGGYRVTQDDFLGIPTIAYLDPASRTTRLGNVFVQDEISLRDDLTLTLGLKLERNSYTGLEYLPNARLGWRPNDRALLWAAVSRGVRTPSRFDTGLKSVGVVAGGPNFHSEYLTAYELGYRGQPTPRLSLSVSAYYNVYDELRTLEATMPAIFPLIFANGMQGETYGVEAWATYELSDWWRLTAGANALRKRLELEPGSLDIFGPPYSGNDPKHQFSLRSNMTLAPSVELDLGLRAVDDLPSPAVPGYAELDARLGWRVSDTVEFSLIGVNLLRESHVEFVDNEKQAREVPRSVRARLRWAF